MYAVILAGGGGTRLHPLSRPERPKPFLPLLGERSLLQATVDRLRRPDRRHHGRHRPPLRAPRPRPGARASALVVEPLGRNTAAAIALAALAIDRPDDEVMVVAAGRPDRSSATTVFRDVLRTAAEHLATGAFGIEDPLVTLGIAVDRPGDRVRLPHPRRRAAAQTSTACAPTRSTRFEEKPKPARAEELVRQDGRRLERRASSCGGAGRSSPRSSATPGLLQSLGPMVGRPAHARARLRGDPAAGLDRLRGHGGRGRRAARS